MYRLVGVLLLHRELSTDRAVYLDNFKFLSASPPVVSNLLLMNEGINCIVMLILLPVIVMIWTFIGISGYGVSLSV